jgi:hypothetical protein
MKNYLAATLTAAALATSLFASPAFAQTEPPEREIKITICVGVIVQVCVEFPI